MSDVFEWSDKYKIGLDAIDAQHKKLVDLINLLHRSLHGEVEKEDKRKSLIYQVLQAVVEYTEKHFIFEEHLLREYEYPDYLKHKKSHERFVSAIKKYEGDYKAGRSTSEELENLLVKWLRNHILTTDRDYVTYLVRHGYENKEDAV